MQEIDALNSQYVKVDLGKGLREIIQGDDGYLSEDPLLDTAINGTAALKITAKFDVAKNVDTIK